MTDRLAHPPFDPELEVALAMLAGQLPPTITEAMILPMRQALASDASAVDALTRAGLEARDVEIPAYDDATIVLTVIQQKNRTGTGPGFYYVHGGGMIFGDRWGGVTGLIEWILRYNAVAVTVEYRLAPEFPDPMPLEDCYSGLVWTADHTTELGIDPERIVIIGVSAGGGLAAGTALLARDRRGPALAGQLLMYPMLDDRDQTVSTRQIDGVGVWDRSSNHGLTAEEERRLPGA